MSPPSGAPVGLVVALYEELRPIARRLRLEGFATGPLHGRAGDVPVVALLSGVGRDRAGQAARRLVQEHGCTALLSAGYAGALNPRWPVGQVLALTAVGYEGEPRQPGDPAWLAALGEAWPQVTGVTVRRALNTAADKAALAASAEVVDMETASVAAAAADCRVPWLGLRAVSDAADQSLPAFVARNLDPHTGEIHLFRMFGYLLPRPGAWPELVDLARRSRAAGRALAEAVAQALEARR